MRMTYVVPVPAPRFQYLFGEAEGALPSAGSGASERKLASVTVPGTDEMDRLDFGAAGERER